MVQLWLGKKSLYMLQIIVESKRERYVSEFSRSVGRASKAVVTISQ